MRTGVSGPLLAAVCTTALLAAGCGSSSHKTTTVTKPALTKAQFVAQANAICTQGNREQAAAVKGFEKTFGAHGPTFAQVSAFVNTTVVPSIQRQINSIRALGAPAGEEAKVKAILDAAQADLDNVKSFPPAIATENVNPFASFAKVAHPYGLTACARR